MKLKGEYAGDTSYSAGDVVRWSDGTIYISFKDSPAGIPPTDTLYWERFPQPLDNVVSMMVDLMKSIPANIDEDSIALKSGDNEYLISVDDTGDTPELAVELIEE